MTTACIFLNKNVVHWLWATAANVRRHPPNKNISNIIAASPSQAQHLRIVTGNNNHLDFLRLKIHPCHNMHQAAASHQYHRWDKQTPHQY